MRYILLVYSKEDDSATPEDLRQIGLAHRTVMTESHRAGVFRAADPLEPTSTATTVRVKNGEVLITDGPFAETKEQLAGYYILDCRDLDEAIAWAAKIPTECKGAPGCIEVRPIREISKPAPVHG